MILAESFTGRLIAVWLGYCGIRRWCRSVYLNLTFEDVEGLGDKDIIVSGKYPVGANPPDFDAMSIFDLRGDEITRQDCKFTFDQTFNTYGDRACAIFGETVTLDCSSRPCTIFGDSEDAAITGRDRAIYKLVNGKYAYQEPPKPKRRVPSRGAPVPRPTG